ncbi:hypothetical protein B0H17DRAFT_669853 [Mycena rosella]|uniref:Uncharacterized protein n=1 Tax=Mycena rosella TaxID=1033263 RepID=A0AAD7GUD4_MYCRO|nr:hypothetical protein B0H17DRAFT_669853 [Mycena rosella]
MATAENALPPELEQEIFETAALMHPSTIPVLLRVARRVLIWIEPFLYRVIRLDLLPLADAVRHAIRTKPASFFQDSVRHLFLNSSEGWSAGEISELLRHCTRLVSFYTTGEFTTPAMLPLLGRMLPVRKWGGPLELLFGSAAAVDLNHPFFRNVTHLDLFDLVKDSDTRLSAGLGALPALTHLCLNNNVGVSFLRRVLEQCAHLQLLIHMWNHFYSEPARGIAANPPVVDVRFVVGVFHSYWDDWEAGARGGVDFWVAADTFVARKRRGEIAASHYLLDHF